MIQNQSDVTGDDMCYGILSKLQFVEGFWRNTKQKGVAEVMSWSDKAVEQSGISMRGEGQTWVINVAKVKANWPGCAVDVWREGENAAGDDTQDCEPEEKERWRICR